MQHLKDWRTLNYGQNLKYSFYFFFSIGYFSFVFVLFPLYLKELGFSAPQIALLSGTSTLATILGGPTIISISHKFIGSRPFALVLFSLALLCHTGLFFTTAIGAVFALCLFSQLCRAGGDSLVTAQSLRDAAKGAIAFEGVRLWGSVGYIIIALTMGPIVEMFGTRSALWCGFVALLLTLVSSIALASFLPKKPGRLLFEPTQLYPTDKLFSNRPFVALLISSFLIWTSHGVLYAYLSVYLSTLGWNTTLISIAWNIGVVSEILFLIAVPFIEKRISLVTLLVASALLTALRWIVLYVSTDISVILLSQVLHAFSFGACYIASLRLCFLLLPDHHRDRGQAFVTALGSGLGGLVGRGLAGLGAWWLDSFSSLNLLFLPAAFVALLATMFVAPISRAIAEKT